MGNLRLRPYQPGDAEIIAGWVKSEYGFRQWSADRLGAYPPDPAAINRCYAQMQANGRGWGLTAFDEAGAAGHLTMRFPGAGMDEVRLGFVIVDDRRRGQGCGSELVRLALRYAFTIVKAQKVSLGVFENNPAALRCYLACGFRVVENAPAESYRCLGEIWNCLQMEMTKPEWDAIIGANQTI